MTSNEPTPVDPIDAKLKKADPAKRYNGKLGPDFLDGVVEGAKARKSGEPQFQIRFQNSMQRGLAIGAAAVLALAIVVPTVLHIGGDKALIQVAISGNRGGMAAKSLVAGKVAVGNLADDVQARCFDCFGTAQYEYADAGLSDTAGSAHVYQMVPKGSPQDLGSVLGAAFDQVGSVHRSSAQGQEAYYFGDLDPFAVHKGDTSTDEYWMKPQVVIYWGASNPSWSYSDPTANVQWACEDSTVGTGGSDSGAAAPDDSGTSEPCKPVIPADAKPISVKDAKAQAIELFKKLGYEVGTVAKHTSSDYLMVKVNADDWNLTVTGFLVVEGQVTNQQIGFYWDAKTGKLAGASGMYSSAKDMGLFPLSSPAAALSRLKNFAWSGDFWADWENFKWSANLNGGMIVTDDMVPVDQPVPVESGATGEPMPVPTPKTVTLSISRSEQTLMGLWDTNQISWLVPGYLYFDDSGYVGNAFAVADGVISVPDYADGVMPMTR